MKSDKYPVPKLAEVSVIDLKKNDKLSRLRGNDLAELLVELEMSPLLIREKLGLPNGTTFGVEIEFENADRQEIREKLENIVPRWDTKSDGSCDGEVVSPILTDIPKSYQELVMVCEAMQKKGAYAKNKTGGHIHIGSQIIGQDFDALMNFLKTWIAFEKVLYRFAYGDKLGARNNINYAKPISEFLHPKLSDFAELNDYRELRRQISYDRQHAVNFYNFRNDGQFKDTIEFRCPNGTINPIVWQNNLNVFAKLLGHCKSEKFDADVVDRKLHNFQKSGNFYKATDAVYLQDALDFADMIFNKNIDKAYFLKQYVKFFNEPKSAKNNMVSYSL